jgi:DNA polymerase kappa
MTKCIYMHSHIQTGMDEVDKEYVKKIVYDMSKDSKFFLNEQRKNLENSKRNDQMRAKLLSIPDHVLTAHQRTADRCITSAEAGRCLSRTFIHVDMDMFFAAVEQIKRPELKHIPFAVGGLSMIATANYVARKYGVRSAMPGFIGKVLCEKPAPGSNLPPMELLFVSHSFGEYSNIGAQVRVWYVCVCVCVCAWAHEVFVSMCLYIRIPHVGEHRRTAVGFLVTLFREASKYIGAMDHLCVRI